MTLPQTHRQIVALWPGIASLAKATGIPPVTVRQWHYRDRIPSGHWARIIKACAVHLSIYLTMDQLATMDARRKPSKAPRKNKKLDKKRVSARAVS